MCESDSRLRGEGRGEGLGAASKGPSPHPLYGTLGVKLKFCHTVLFPLAWSFDWGVAVDGPVPLDHHESGGAGPSTATARTRQSEASLPSGGDDRATTLYSVWDARGGRPRASEP